MATIETNVTQITQTLVGVPDPGAEIDGKDRVLVREVRILQDGTEQTATREMSVDEFHANVGGNKAKLLGEVRDVAMGCGGNTHTIYAARLFGNPTKQI